MELRVHPTLVPSTHPLANIYDDSNTIYVKGNAVGELILKGRGGVDLPTGSSVVSDIISILTNDADISNLKVERHKSNLKEVKIFGENESEFYNRLNIKD